MWRDFILGAFSAGVFMFIVGWYVGVAIARDEERRKRLRFGADAAASTPHEMAIPVRGIVRRFADKPKAAEPHTMTLPDGVADELYPPRNGPGMPRRERRPRRPRS